jgi:hypothetical protein
LARKKEPPQGLRIERAAGDDRRSDENWPNARAGAGGGIDQGDDPGEQSGQECQPKPADFRIVRPEQADEAEPDLSERHRNNRTAASPHLFRSPPPYDARLGRRVT